MSSDIAITVRELSKCYHVYDKPRDRLKQLFTFGEKRFFREFWALKNISFDINKAETVGIIGRNGSGKSTLLQLICGTLNPTAGNIHAHGRIAALLELGSGFNPEFTGRENVYMNAAILGLNKAEVDEKFDEIETFADIGDFIEQPVKAYSSGMMMRLAFAVAINVEPEILVIDEALSVGDELFQRKCFSKIQELKDKGATILFVSHAGGAIIELCDRAILIDDGELLLDGIPKHVVGMYQKLLYSSDEKRFELRRTIKNGDIELIQDSEITNLVQEKVEDNQRASNDLDWFEPSLVTESSISYQSHGVVIDDIKIINSKSKQVNHLVRNEKYKYQYSVQFNSDAQSVVFGMLIKTKSGLELGGGISSLPDSNTVSFIPKNTKVVVEFEFDTSLASGTYFMNAGVNGSTNGDSTYLHRVLDALVFKVLPDDSELHQTGIIDFSVKYTAEISCA